MRSKWMAVLGLCGVMLVAASVGQRLPPEPAFAWKAQGETTATSTKCFPTGLRLSVQRRPGMEVVSVTTTLSVGSRQRELGGGEGAHMLEHLWFQSQPRGVVVWDELRAMGAEFNAFTAADVTMYTTSVRNQELKSVLALEMARLRDPLVGVDQSIVDVEAAVVANEARQRGIEDWVSSPQVNDMLYPIDHVYYGATREKVAPDLASLTELGREYGHETASILVIGDVSPNEVQSLLFEVEPRLKEVLEGDEVTCFAPSGRAKRPPEPMGQSAGRVKGRGLRPGVGVAWTLPGSWNGQDALAAYVSQVLERNIETVRAERLYGTELRDRGFDSRHRCGVVQRQFGSVLACEIYGDSTARDGRVSKNFVANAQRDVVDALQRVSAPPGDLNYISKMELADRQMTQISLLNRFRALGDIRSPLYGELAPFLHLHFQGRHDYAASNLDALYEVTPQQVADFAATHLTQARMVAVEFTPGLQKVSASVQRPESAVERPPVSLKSGLANRVERLPKPAESKTSGGLRVLVVPSSQDSQAVVRMRFLRPVSDEPSPWLDELMDYETWHVEEPWVGGTSLKGRTIGLSLAYGYDNAGVFWQLRGSAQNLEQMLYLMRALTLQFQSHTDSANPAEVDYIGTYLSTEAGVLMNAQLFQGAPLGQRAGREPLVSGSMVKRRYKQVYDPANATLEIVGGVEPQQALDWAETYLGAWETRGKGGVVPEPQERVLPERSLQWRDRPWSSALIRYSCRLQDVEQSDPAAQAVLLERFRSELTTTLRHETGLTYTPEAWLARWPGGGSTLNAEIAVAPSNVGPATLALLAVSDALPGTPEQVEAARAARVAHSANELVTLDQLAHRLDRYAVYGADFQERWATGLLGLGVQDLERELQGCQGHEVVFIEGFGKYMEPSIAASGLEMEALESPHRPEDEWIRAQNK